MRAFPFTDIFPGGRLWVMMSLHGQRSWPPARYSRGL